MLGFILLVVVGIVLFAFIKAKTRTHHANQMGAVRDLLSGGGRAPSWSMNLDRRDEFLKALQVLPARKGVPHAFIVKNIEDQEMFRTFVQYAGAMERRNSSFPEQQVAVSEMIVKLWERLGHDERSQYIHVPHPTIDT